jgi:hypothetical protein
MDVLMFRNWVLAPLSFLCSQSLRTPISDLRLFPPDKDPARSPITVEEIKKLIRFAFLDSESLLANEG